MKLVNKIYTSNSILNKKDEYVPVTIGTRPRLATCTSVCWLNNRVIASLNLYGNTITTYEFDDKKNEFRVLQEIKNEDGARLSMSEHMSISNDGTLIAVCSAPPLFNSTPKACVNIYRFDKDKHLVNPVPIHHMEEDYLIHNVRFSPDDKYMAYADYDDSRAINIYSIIRDGDRFEIKPVFSKENHLIPMKSKAINFTRDGKFIIVAYCVSLANLTTEIKSCLVCYEFRDGKIGKVISEFNHNLGMEDIAFSQDDTIMYVSDQMNDKILKYGFDKTSGSISYIESHNPDNTLSFPHGISISKDDKYLAAANYGGDKFNVYQL